MYKRREIFPLASGLAGMAGLLGAGDAEAATRDRRFDPYKMPDQMREKYSTRMPTLDRQAAEDFYGSFRLAMGKQYETLERDVVATLAEQGVKADPDCSLQ